MNICRITSALAVTTSVVALAVASLAGTAGAQTFTPISVDYVDCPPKCPGTRQENDACCRPKYGPNKYCVNQGC